MEDKLGILKRMRLMKPRNPAAVNGYTTAQLGRKTTCAAQDTCLIKTVSYIREKYKPRTSFDSRRLSFHYRKLRRPG